MMPALRDGDSVPPEGEPCDNDRLIDYLVIDRLTAEG